MSSSRTTPSGSITPPRPWRPSTCKRTRQRPPTRTNEFLRLAGKENGAGAPFAQRRSPRSAHLQDPLDELLDVAVGHRRVGRHRHRAPDALAALLDLLRELVGGLGLAPVLLRHLLE